MTNLTISIPDTLKTFVEHQIAAKGFGNVSEYFRSLLRQAQAEEEDVRLEALLLEGLRSGDDVAINEAFWTELKAEAKQIAQKYKAGGKAQDKQ
jgi:antitoxin ParD1/3/4